MYHTSLRCRNLLPGYLRVDVDAAITVETNELISENEGLLMCNELSAMRLSAVLSNTNYIKYVKTCVNSMECKIWSTYDAISIQNQSFECQDRIVRLHNDVWRFLLIREHWIGLDQLLGITIIQSLQQVRAHAWTSTTSNRVDHNKSLYSDWINLTAQISLKRLKFTHLQTVTVICFSINHFKNFIRMLFSLIVAFLKSS